MSGPFSALLGASDEVVRVREQARRVAPTPLPILVRGETGTGKEVLARGVHEASGRPGPFVPVDCAALAPSLVESELFGHVRGAFTGARTDRRGLVAHADGGTLFLDEVAELSLDLQTRLLRLVQEGSWRPVGSETRRTGDIRIVAATWRDLRDEVRAGRFREDLFHRLAVVELELPPLRRRGADLLELAAHFLELEARQAGRSPPRMAPRLRQHLVRLAWPGNVRELRHAMAYLAVVPTSAEVDVEDLPARLRRVVQPPREPGGPPVRTDLPYLEARRVWLDAFQHRYIAAILDEHDGNVSAAARAAGLDRRTIQRVRARLFEAQRGEDPDSGSQG